eukprot:4322687-Amphidinium_carterae.1
MALRSLDEVLVRGLHQAFCTRHFAPGLLVSDGSGWLSTPAHCRVVQRPLLVIRRRLPNKESTTLKSTFVLSHAVESVLALRIQNNEGHIFVQLGKYDHQLGKVTPALLLPGGKQASRPKSKRIGI